ncbi:response regulator transcription factor [Mesorhizobium marinum]|uniref:response regulator transcription factor n=1 Tax=Mesorhizobium marinum TaxID=3228790 RepID=UPI0034653B62
MADLICLVDDDASFRTSISRLLQLRGYDVVQFASAGGALEALRNGLTPNCILLDVKMPNLSGPTLQERLRELEIDSPIIFLTGYGDIPTTVTAIKAGAEDVLSKPVPEQVLIGAIQRATDRFQVERSKSAWRRTARTLLESLTPREREVFERVVRGKANKLAARELGITERTVKAHRQRIFEKLHAKTVAELVSLAARLEILEETTSRMHDDPAQGSDQ